VWGHLQHQIPRFCMWRRWHWGNREETRPGLTNIASRFKHPISSRQFLSKWRVQFTPLIVDYEQSLPGVSLSASRGKTNKRASAHRLFVFLDYLWAERQTTGSPHWLGQHKDLWPGETSSVSQYLRAICIHQCHQGYNRPSIYGAIFRGTQWFVSANICPEGLKSPDIFGF